MTVGATGAHGENQGCGAAIAGAELSRSVVVAPATDPTASRIASALSVSARFITTSPL
jgi:hypothetical protein